MLYIPIGPPGCGKDYLANHMIEVDMIGDDDVVSSDHYRRILSGDQTNQTVTGKVFKIVDTIVWTRLQHNLDVYLNATNLTAKDLRNVLTSAVENGQPITLMVTSLKREVIEAQNASKHRQNLGTVVPAEAMERMFARLETMQTELPKIAEDFNVERFTTIEDMLEEVADIRFSEKCEGWFGL